MIRAAGAGHVVATLAVLLALMVAPAGAAPPSSAEAATHFEKHVRPILVEHCVGCHGRDKQRGGLRLDSAAGLRKGSDNGSVVVAGNPDKSILIQAVRHDGATKMPPRGRLPESAVAALVEWVRQGAVWPGGVENAPTAGDAWKKHWAFQPVRDPPPPQVRDRTRVATPIDAFLLGRLEAAGLSPSPIADRRTLIRRVTFDLHGLPPTPEEVEAFTKDESPDAWRKLIDRLLASPHYGERWGRHWLDVARYADTKGYVRLADNPRYPTAWTYRDWVIRALNEELPYDQFILQQLAADRLPLGDDKRPLAAMGFLTLGPRYLNSKYDILDDRIDVVCRGLMGLTVSCARCHDHKFDPIPTRDYYALAGVFAAAQEPRAPPLIATAAERARRPEYERELQKRIDEFEEFLRSRHDSLRAGFRERAADYLLAAQREQLQANFLPVMFLVDGVKDLNPVMIQRWGEFLKRTRKTHHPVMAPWHALAELKPDEFAARAPDVLRSLANDPQRTVNRPVIDALSDPPPRDLPDAARRYGSLFRSVLSGEDDPSDFPIWEVEDYLFVNTVTQNEFHAKQRRVEDFIATPDALPHALTLEDLPRPPPSRVLIRGNPANPGEAVPRQFLSLLAGEKRRPFTDGSGRLELAKAIASRDNPLTARVLVNRVWMHHFGRPLVGTPGDFGLRSEPPTHPELLDHLAAFFVDNGWSLKKLHRHILLSAAYRQRSDDRPECRKVDPENALLWRANVRRLDFESLRDSFLAVSGRLDTTPAGPSVDLTAQPFSTRRSVYGFIDRRDLPGLFRTFDFPRPDATTPRRHQTTVPQQALFLMNGPFLAEQTRALAARPGAADAEGYVVSLYRLLFQRRPDAAELSLGVQFVAKDPHEEGKLSRREQYAQVLLLSNEFAFAD